jgi:protein-S-isoprenylcysteine O-methyltransferase Ste14
MGWASKIAGYFFGVIIVLFGFLWISSTMTMSVIIIGSIGLVIVLGGFIIMYLGHRTGKKNKQLQPQ